MSVITLLPFILIHFIFFNSWSVWQTECQSACGFILTVTESRAGSGTREDISALRSRVRLQDLPAFLFMKGLELCVPSRCQHRPNENARTLAPANEAPAFLGISSKPSTPQARVARQVPTSIHSRGTALGCVWGCLPLLHRPNSANISLYLLINLKNFLIFSPGIYLNFLISPELSLQLMLSGLPYFVTDTFSHKYFSWPTSFCGNRTGYSLISHQLTTTMSSQSGELRVTSCA